MSLRSVEIPRARRTDSLGYVREVPGTELSGEDSKHRAPFPPVTSRVIVYSLVGQNHLSQVNYELSLLQPATESWERVESLHEFNTRMMQIHSICQPSQWGSLSLQNQEGGESD